MAYEIANTRYTFQGGINNTLHPDLIGDQECPDALNFIPKSTGDGNLIVRPGYSSYAAVESTGATYVTSFYGGQRNRYFTFYDASASQFKIYDLDDGTTSLYTQAATKAQNWGSWASFGTYDLFVDGAVGVKTVNGTAFTAIGSLPTTTNVICPYNNYLFALKTNDTDRLFWSDLLDPETWPAENYIELGLPTVFDQLISLRTINDKLIIFTQHGFYALHGYSNTDWTVSYQQQIAGADLHAATLATPFGLMWWNQNHGLCMCKDGYNVDFPMVRKLAHTLGDATSFINKLCASAQWRPDRQCARFWIKDAHASYPLGYPNLTIDYYPASDTFWLSRIVDADATGVVSCGSVETITTVITDVRMAYYIGKQKTAVAAVWKEDQAVATDNGDSYTAYVKTKKMSYASPLAQKYTPSVMVTAKPVANDSTVTYSAFLNNDTAATKTVTLTVDSGTQDALVGLNANHRKIQHYVSMANDARDELISISEDTSIENQL